MNSLGFDKKKQDTKVVVAMSGGVDSSVAAAITGNGWTAPPWARSFENLAIKLASPARKPARNPGTFERLDRELKTRTLASPSPISAQACKAPAGGEVSYISE